MYKRLHADLGVGRGGWLLSQKPHQANVMTTIF